MSTNQMNDYGVSAEVVAHSAYGDEELITVEIQMHRFILPEFNTHRVLSRNFQSTRAVPTTSLIEQVRNNPAVPSRFAKNRSGMVAGEIFEGVEHDNALNAWLISAKSAADNAQILTEMGVHKEVAGRLLEPFMWTKGIVTATKKGWDSFLNLRLHPDAQPEIQLLAMCIDAAIKDSDPITLNVGSYHLPYISPSLVDEIGVRNAVKVSCSCAAQISYRKRDSSLDKASRVYDMLNLPVDGVYPDDPPHYSPTEHIAKVEFDGLIMSGNFQSDVFMQYRKYLEIGVEREFFGEVL